MRKIIVIVAAVVLLFAVLPVAAGYWIVYTPSGLRFAFGQLYHLRKIVRIEATGVRGALASGFHVDRLDIDHARVRIVIEDLQARVRPRALWLQTVHVETASVRHIHIEVLPHTRSPNTTPLKFLPSFLRVAVDDARVGGTDLTFPNHYRLLGNELSVSVLLTSRHLRATRLQVDGGFFTAAGSIDLGAADPLQLDAGLQWTLLVPQTAPWRGSAQLQGDLNELKVTAEQTVPIQAHIQGRALHLTQDLHWEAQIASPAVDFSRLAPAAKVTAKDLRIDVRGDRAGMDIEGSLTPTSLPTGRLDITTHGPYPTRHVQFDRLIVQGNGGARFDARLSMDFNAGGPALDLRGQARQFRWPMIGADLVRSPAADFSLSGAALPYRLAVTGPVSVKKMPPFALRATGLLDHDHLSLDRSTAQWLKGSITGEGAVSWVDRRAWHFDIRGQNLDPSGLQPGWPGRIDVSAALTGAGLDADADLDLRVAQLRGIVRGQAISASGGVRRRGSRFDVDQVDGHWGSAKLDVDGTYGATQDLRFTLDAPHVEQLVSQLSGAIAARGHISGPSATARLTATIDGHALQGESFNIAALHTTADIDLSDRLSSQLTLKADGVQIGSRDFGRVDAELSGSASNHRFVLNAEQGLVEVHATFEGAYAPKIWTGRIAELKLKSGYDVDLHLAAAAPLQLSVDRVELRNLCLLGNNERVCAGGDWKRGGAFNADLNARGVPLHALGANMPSAPEYKGVLGVAADVHGHSLLDMTGHLSFDLAGGAINYKLLSGRQETLQLGGGHGEITATPTRIDSAVHLAATDDTFLDVKIGGTRAANQDLLQIPLTGSIHAQAHELGFLPLLIPQIDRASGQINADLALSGTLAAPEFEGALILKNGQMDLYQVNLLMRAIDARLDLAGSALKIAASAAIGTGKASVAGDLSWSQRKPVGNLKLTGEKLMMVNIPEIRADASPDIDLKIDGRRIDVSGSVTIPYARIKPADLTGATLSSSDEIIVGDAADDSEKGFQVYTDVKLVLGSDVTVDTFGLKGRLTGSVSVESDPTGSAFGSGELKVEEGSYAAYGRQLDIQRGRLIFSGGLVSDPAVDLLARKVFPEVTAYVNVRGRLRNPQINFYSDPSLPQSQVISVLLAGGTIESTQATGTQQASNQARNELLAQGGAIFAQQLGQKFGVGDVGLESDTLNQTSLVVGRFLNPRLYVSYGISLTESINTVKLRYTLGDHWTIKTEAGEERSTDLVFTIEH